MSTLAIDHSIEVTIHSGDVVASATGMRTVYGSGDAAVILQAIAIAIAIA